MEQDMEALLKEKEQWEVVGTSTTGTSTSGTSTIGTSSVGISTQQKTQASTSDSLENLA